MVFSTLERLRPFIFLSMKKILLTLLAGIAASAVATAQKPISLKWQDYGRFPTSDNIIRIGDLLPLSSINIPDTNVLWTIDLSMQAGNDFIRRDSLQVINSGGFPGFVYSQKEAMNLGNINYSGSVEFTRDTFSLNVTGRKIDNSTTVSLDSITGVATDELYIPSQQISMFDQDSILKFPASMDSTWASMSYSAISYEITVAAAQYNRKAFTRNITTEMTGTVIGWGKAQITNYGPNGEPSGPMDVLQVKVVEVKTSSFGGTINPVVLNALSLREGGKDTSSYIWLMRKGETTPLLSVRYKGLPSSIPEEAWLQNERIAAPLSVTTVAAHDNTRIYPNPVRRGSMLFVAGEGAGNWQMRLSSLTGQQVHEVRWTQTQSSPQAVQLPQELAEGMYIFQLIQNGQPVKTGRVLVSE